MKMIVRWNLRKVCLAFICIAKLSLACMDQEGPIWLNIDCAWVAQHNTKFRCNLIKNGITLGSRCEATCNLCESAVARNGSGGNSSCAKHTECNTGYCANGYCKWRKKIGQNCNGHNACRSRYCPNDIPRTCKVKPKIDNGGKCWSNNQCKSGFCRKPRNSSGQQGECATVIPWIENGKRCEKNRYCKSGNCSNSWCAPTGNNKPCTADKYCSSGNCYNNVCAPKLKFQNPSLTKKNVGESCSNDNQCNSNTCHTSSGYCLPDASCQVLGGYAGEFDQNTIVMVFVGSGFKNLLNLEQTMTAYFDYMSNAEFFNDSQAKYKALYVRKISDSFCSYGCLGVDRLLCCEQADAEAYTNNCFPKGPRLQTVVIHNNPQYGGAGYNDENMATTSLSASGKPLLLHEIGHSLFNFGDEYSAGDATPENSPNCDYANCPKWNDLHDEKFVGGRDHNKEYCSKRGCKGGKYFVGRNSFMKIHGFPVGDVNLRFTCCTYLELTNSMPSYCEVFEFNPNKSLSKYCRSLEDFYPSMSRRLTDEVSDSNNSIVDFNIGQDYQVVKNPVALSVDVTTKKFKYHSISVENKNTDNSMLYPIRQIQGDYDNIIAANDDGADSLHQIEIVYDSGKTAELFYKVESSRVSVPPLDLFDDTITDDSPSSVQLHSDVHIVVDGSNGKISKIDVNQINIV